MYLRSLRFAVVTTPVRCLSLRVYTFRNERSMYSMWSEKMLVEVVLKRRFRVLTRFVPKVCLFECCGLEHALERKEGSAYVPLGCV